MTTRPLSVREQAILDKELDAAERLQWYVQQLPDRRDVRNVALVSGTNMIFAGVFWLYMCPKV